MSKPTWSRESTSYYERHGRRKLSLVGWSLGGLYARHIAKIRPDKIRCMISLGSPFAGSHLSTNAWQVYEWASGTKVEDNLELSSGALADAPPVPTTSLFSRTDGICAWQNCLNEETHQAENIEVIGSHCGLGHHPAAVFAVADRLAATRRAVAEVRSLGLEELGLSRLAPRIGTPSSSAAAPAAPTMSIR